MPSVSGDRSTMRAEAVRVMTEAMYAQEPGEPFEVYAAAAFDKLFSPQSVPCSECHGTNRVKRPYNRFSSMVYEPCPAPGCKDGQVSSLPLAFLAGEQTLDTDRWTTAVQATTDRLHAENHNGTHVSGFCRPCAENYTACNVLADELGFRIRSGEDT